MEEYCTVFFIIFIVIIPILYLCKVDSDEFINEQMPSERKDIK